MIAKLSLLMLSVFWASTVVADDPPKPSDKPDQKAPTAQETKPAAKAESERPLAPGDDELLKSLEKKSAPAEADEDPLLRVGQRMRNVQGRLTKADPGDETQDLQKGIVQDLDQLIEQIKKGGG
jgi:hypothetical protein